MAGILVSVCQCAALIGSHLASYPGYQPHLQRLNACRRLACSVLFCFGDIPHTCLFMTHAQLIFVFVDCVVSLALSDCYSAACLPPYGCWGAADCSL